MKDDIVLNKAAIIERCIYRVKEEYIGFEKELTTNQTKQDAILLNIQRACEASIDLGTHIIRVKKLGLPQGSRDIFNILAAEKIISEILSKRLQAMVGFRNLAIHEYQKLNLDIVKSVIEHCLDDFLEFAKSILTLPTS